MSSYLPINLDDLLHNRGVESERVEFKKSWDEVSVGPQVLRTICAFANDLHNLNGGYVVLGVAERDGRAILPPEGLSESDSAAAESWIRGNCNRLDPPCAPLLSRETVEGRSILVVWAPASDTKPHRAPNRHGQPRFWVRVGSETVDAEQRGDLARQLIDQTARVPWDDRRAHDARVEDLRETKVREFLRDVGSGLIDEPDGREIYRRMRIVARANGHETPRNVGLLFFSNDPERWFRGAKIEVVQFASDRASNVLEERTFRGGLADQLRDCLNYLENLSASHLQKQPDRSQVRGWVSYPLIAVRETLVNALYHRGYSEDQPEPVKVYLHPDRIEVISYPGPVPGIETGHFGADVRVPSEPPARNRRIGEFLKELKLAETRHTGLPKIFRAMAENGSPAPTFDFDETRTWFRATLPAHPEYAALSTARDAAYLRAVGEHREAFRRIEAAWAANPGSTALAVEMMRACMEEGDTKRAEDVLSRFEGSGPAIGIPQIANTLIETVLEAGDETRARQLMKKYESAMAGRDAIDAAILARRARDSQRAHRYFQRAGDAVHGDPRALLEFAQTKIWLQGEAHRNGQRDVAKRLLTEARTLLEQVTQLDASPTRHAWAWREMARVLEWLRAPFSDVETAYGKAIESLPDEPRFVSELENARNRHRERGRPSRPSPTRPPSRRGRGSGA